MSHLKLSERTQLFSSPSCTKFCDMDIDEIPWPHGNFSRRAVFILRTSSLTLPLVQRKKLFRGIFFMSKLKRLVHDLSYRRCRCLVHSVFLKYVLNCIWSKQAIVLLIINGKITFLNFSYSSYSSYSCAFFILSYFLFHTLRGTVRKMAIDMFWQP